MKSRTWGSDRKREGKEENREETGGPNSFPSFSWWLHAELNREVSSTFSLYFMFALTLLSFFLGTHLSFSDLDSPLVSLSYHLHSPSFLLYDCIWDAEQWTICLLHISSCSLSLQFAPIREETKVVLGLVRGHANHNSLTKMCLAGAVFQLYLSTRTFFYGGVYLL